MTPQTYQQQTLNDTQSYPPDHGEFQFILQRQPNIHQAHSTILSSKTMLTTLELSIQATIHNARKQQTHQLQTLSTFWSIMQLKHACRQKVYIYHMPILQHTTKLAQNQVRIKVGQNHINYPYKVTTQTAYLDTAKILWENWCKYPT